MQKINPVSALYIKLGPKGEYEEESLLQTHTVHVGWIEVPYGLCERGEWDNVRLKILPEVRGHQGTATNLRNQLRKFYESGTDVLWITFYQDHLYWCFADQTVTMQADGSRIRKAIGGWKRCDINGKDLDSSRLSGSLLAIQGYQSTICNVSKDNLTYLVRKINGESSPHEQKAIAARDALIDSLVEIIQELHWKEFELLSDLIFRQAGWQRLGVLGKAQKDIDLDLLSPITQERYRVQVKAAAGVGEYQILVNLASTNQEFARYYFVVHRPDASLQNMVEDPLVKIWFAKDVARFAVNYGLADWIIAKAK